MKTKDFFDNLNVFFKNDEDVDDIDMLDNNAQIFAYAYKNEEGEIYEIRIFNPEYRELLTIDSEGNVTPLNLEK